MMTRNDAVAMQQFCAMMTFSDALPVLSTMDTVTTRAWEFSQTLYRILLCNELTATFDPTMRFKRSNSNLENFHDVFVVAAFS